MFVAVGGGGGLWPCRRLRVTGFAGLQGLGLGIASCSELRARVPQPTCLMRQGRMRQGSSLTGYELPRLKKGGRDI